MTPRRTGGPAAADAAAACARAKLPPPLPLPPNLTVDGLGGQGWEKGWEDGGSGKAYDFHSTLLTFV